MAIDVEAAYARYGPMVLRRCRRLLGDEEAALDAMHDSFVTLVRHGARLEDRGLSSLLYRIATNTCLNLIRTKKRRPGDTGSASLLEQIAFADDPLEGSLGRLWVERVLGRAPESTRTVAVMHFIDGMTHEEIAEAVGLSVSGVRKRLRALQGIAASMEDA